MYAHQIVNFCDRRTFPVQVDVEDGFFHPGVVGVLAVVDVALKHLRRQVPLDDFDKW